MARKLTKEAIRGLLNKGLTGWERGKLVIQDFADRYCEKPPFLTDADVAEIKRGLSGDKNIRDYNDLMAMGRGIERGLMMCSMTWPEACLDLCTLIEMLEVVEMKNTIDFFESCMPRVVTAKQYQDIISAQKEKKLKFEYCLGYVIEERFYAIAPAEARAEIDEICPDIESVEGFISAVPEKYKDLCKQATDEIRRLYINGKLPAVFHKKDAKKAEPLVAKWKSNKLSAQDTMKLVDMLFVNGQQLYECEELPEWKDYMDKYSKYIFADEDEHFNHSYAVLEDCPKCWMDEQGYYKYPISTDEWVTRAKEIIWGLRAIDGEKTRSIQTVSRMLLKILDRVQLNIRMFLAVKTVIDTASEVIDVSFSEGAGVMDGVFIRVLVHIRDYNSGLKSLNEDRRWSNDKETKLEKVLKTLNNIDIEKLKPSAESIERLKNNITNNKDRDSWLQEKVHSLEYEDGLTFTELLSKDRK
jgi:hypothetical protein